MIIEQRGQGYIYDLFSVRSTMRGVRCGLKPLEAATEASRILAQLRHEGASTVAPPEVLELIPAHLRDFEGENA